MTRWLCIEAQLLAGRYHGTRDDGRAAQWPPDPYRLFQALVAAANLGFRRADFDQVGGAALAWLESRDPPEIIAAPAAPLTSLRLYVPNNDMDRSTLVTASGKPPASLRTAKDLLAHQVSGDRTVRYLWPIEDGEWATAGPHADRLCFEARHLHCLGLGIDLVAGNGRLLMDQDKTALPGEPFVSELGRGGWRVPVAGSLIELQERYASRSTRVVAAADRGRQRYVTVPTPPAMWTEVGYRRRSLGTERPVHLFSLVDSLGESRSFDSKRTIEIAGWLRHAAHMAAKNLELDPGFIESFVCGHGGDPLGKSERFSYLPLPTIAPRGRDGRIRRALIIEPPAGGGESSGSVMNRLAGASLVVEGTGEVMAEVRPAAARDGVHEQYLPAGGARRWGTVTPIVLPGHDDRRSRKAVGLVLKALAQAGYTTPVAEVTLQKLPVFPGQDPCDRYWVPKYLKPYPRAHAVIEFAQKVPGPIAIGAGRHIGLGLFAKLDDGGSIGK